MTTSSNAPYSGEQILEYFTHIGLPSRYFPSNRPILDIKYLTALHVHQISTIPYENLSLHYSTKRTLSLDPKVLFHKFITKGCNRGGYCMEASLFFLFMLQSLGFDAYPTGARIRLRENGVPKGDFIGLVHIVIIVTLSTEAGYKKYALDVAFGGDGPTRPLLLEERILTANLGKQEVQFVHEPLPQNPFRPLSIPQKYWIYQYRNSVSADWNSFYCFTETEFLLGDFNVMNFFTSQGQTFQRVTVLVVKFLRGESELDGIVGKLMLVNGVLKRNLGGKTEIVKDCRNEDERIDVLKKWFRIGLTEEEVNGIKGSATELPQARE